MSGWRTGKKKTLKDRQSIKAKLKLRFPWIDLQRIQNESDMNLRGKTCVRYVQIKVRDVMNSPAGSILEVGSQAKSKDERSKKIQLVKKYSYINYITAGAEAFTSFLTFQVVIFQALFTEKGNPMDVWKTIKEQYKRMYDLKFCV